MKQKNAPGMTVNLEQIEKESGGMLFSLNSDKAKTRLAVFQFFCENQGLFLLFFGNFFLRLLCLGSYQDL